MTNQIAATILKQLGGGRFVTMTGAKYLTSDGPNLMFGLPSRNWAKDGINKVRITLDPFDTYTIEFMKIGKRKGVHEVKTVKKTEGIYCDMLQEVFTRYTGLDTHL